MAVFVLCDLLNEKIDLNTWQQYVTTRQMKYSVRQIYDIADGVQLDIPDATFATINQLCTQVGAPPIASKHFAKKRKAPRAKLTEATADEWERDKFQATKMEVKIGIEADISKLRLFLNKLTNKTYLELKDKISAKILDICEKSTGDDDLNKVKKILYDICSTNRFYSGIFADLFVDLCNQYEWLAEHFQSQLEHLREEYKNIQYVDSNVDYDGFCEMNKQNERRRSVTTFYVNLTKNKYIAFEHLEQLLGELLREVLTLIHTPGKKNEVDELSEIIFLLVHERVTEEFPNEEMRSTMESLASAKAKDFASLSNKAIFKFMDLVAEY